MQKILIPRTGMNPESFNGNREVIPLSNVEKLRQSKSPGMTGYYLQLGAAVVWVAAAFLAASYGNAAMAVFFLGPVPFLVAAAARTEQSRVHRGLLAEIDALRAELDRR